MNTTRNSQFTVPTHSAMHAAVDARDAAQDGRFFYGVVTTGVYCRPSCRSRTALRENRRFFLDHGSAEAAGFRPCKRCQPQRAGQDQDELVKVARHIEAHADELMTLATLATTAKLSPSSLQKKFTAAFGISPRQFQEAARLGQLKSALKTSINVTDAIFAAGYGSTSRVYGEAARNMGMTPAAYRDGGAGETLYHACRKTALGPMLMAATERGVCFAQFGESCDVLKKQLQAEFPAAVLKHSAAENAPDLDNWMQALDAHLARRAPRPDLPLDLRGTAFQLKVWRFLLGAAEGDVLSYRELARGIGKPRAVRAVASACGANRVAVLVPCHRVLRGNGDLGGYRWGSERKRTLLDSERGRRAQRDQ